MFAKNEEAGTLFQEFRSFRDIRWDKLYPMSAMTLLRYRLSEKFIGSTWIGPRQLKGQNFIPKVGNIKAHPRRRLSSIGHRCRFRP